MNKVSSLLLAGTLLAPGVITPARPEAISQLSTAELLACYQKLRNLAPDNNRPANVENVEVARGGSIFQLKSGVVYFLEPVNGKVTGAIFVGKGLYRLKPPGTIEQRQMARFNDGQTALEEPFTEAVFLFTDDTFGEISKQAKIGPASAAAKAAGILGDFRKKFRKRLRTNIEAQILANLSGGMPPYFLADFKGDKHGSLLFEVDPAASEAVKLVSYKPDRVFETWTSYQPEGNAAGAADLVDVKNINLDIRIEKGEKIAASAQVEFETLAGGARMLRVTLAPTLRVAKIADSSGKELSFIQEDKKKDAALWVLLPSPLVKGEKGVWTFTYQGEDVVESAGSGNYYVGSRTNWYPKVANAGESFSDRAVYRMKFQVPKGNMLVATGKLIARRQEGNYEVSEWESVIPYTVAGFNYGKFKVKSVKHDKIEVTVYANPGLQDELNSLRVLLDTNPEIAQMAGITTGGLNTTAMSQKTAAEALNSMHIFTKCFGDIPFPSISVTQQPSGSFGQSWPTLVFMPFTALLDSTTRNQLGLSKGSARRFFEEVGPHEISHQWWGHIVSWKTYRDQWLSEGFAQFSAGLYLFGVDGNKKFNGFLESERHSILDKLSSGDRPNDLGPIWLGYRLSSEKNPEGYRLIYTKGGYVLHMLRMMLHDYAKNDDSRFFAMMKDFVQSHYNQSASTEDFKKIVDKHFGMDMSWFFKQWVYGTEIPRIEVMYTVSETPQGARISGKILQKEVSPDFRVILPLIFRKGGGMMAGSLSATGESTAFQANLPSKPDSIDVNPDHAVLVSDLKVTQTAP